MKFKNKLADRSYSFKFVGIRKTGLRKNLFEHIFHAQLIGKQHRWNIDKFHNTPRNTMTLKKEMVTLPISPNKQKSTCTNAINTHRVENTPQTMPNNDRP